MPDGFVVALDEATRTTAKESSRFALSRMQLRGRPGQVVATDGKQLLIQGGFRLPWIDDVLVARISAFGLRELSEQSPVAVGRIEGHVAVRAGRWTFWLAIDPASRFPRRPGRRSETVRGHLSAVPRSEGCSLPGADLAEVARPGRRPFLDHPRFGPRSAGACQS